MMPVSQGSRGGGATGAGGPQGLVADVVHSGGDPAPAPDSTVGVVATSTSLTMTEPAAEAPSLHTPSGATTPETMPEVDTTVATGDATIGDGDSDELEVVTGHPRPWALEDVSLSEVMGVAHFTLCQAQEVLE
jgi:hypothetical protein